MNSCITVPQDEILLALDEANLQLFADIVNDDELDINHEYVERNCSSLLYLCVSGGKLEFTKEVLRRRDVNPNVPHKILKKYPLHQAVEDGNVVLVDLLLRAGSDINVKMENGNMPLHLAAVRSASRWVKGDTTEQEEMRENFVAITKMLLSVPGINIDSKNNIGVTPLFFAVDKGSEAVARELLLKRACINVEVDGETIEEKIEEKMPSALEGLDLTLNRHDNDAIENKLFHLLYHEHYDPGKFIEAWMEAESNNNKVYVDADNGTYTFLQFCADQVPSKVLNCFQALCYQ